MWGISKSLKSLNNPQVMITKTSQEGPKKRFVQTVPQTSASKRPKTVFPN